MIGKCWYMSYKTLKNSIAKWQIVLPLKTTKMASCLNNTYYNCCKQK